MGFTIFIKCLSQVIRNARVALKMSAFWIAVGVVVLAILGSGFFSQDFTLVSQDSSGRQTFIPVTGRGYFLLLTALATGICGVIAMLNMAIGWHRYVLRSEEPPMVVLFVRDWPAGSYFWKSIVMLLLIVLTNLAIGFVIGVVLSGMGIAISVGGQWAMNFLFSLIAGWLVLRLGACLPGIAMGKPTTIKESWQATKSIDRQLIVTALLMMLFNNVPLLLLGIAAIAPAAGAISLFLVAIFQLLNFFVSVGILTVVYGYCFENRPI